MNDTDLYVMINAYWFPLTFNIQEGNAADWKQIMDTDLDSPDDFRDPKLVLPLSSLSYMVQPRSVVVFIRSKSNVERDQKASF